jgi:hypothetical protein
MSLFIDHVAILAPSLATATADFHARTGVEPRYGGSHSDGGTCNALVSLGERTYLEIAAPDPAQSNYPTETADWAAICRSLPGPKVYAWCVAAPNLHLLRERLQTFAVTARGPVPDSRRRPDGVELHWDLLLAEQARFGTAFPFFIDWRQSPHPAAYASGGCRLRGFVVHHPAAAELREIFKAIALDVPVVESAQPAFALEVDTPKGIVGWHG